MGDVFLYDIIALEDIDWIAVVTANFVDGIAAPSQDPNGLSAGPLVVHTSNGDVTLDMQETVPAWDGIGEGASYRLDILTAANGWRGDGSQMLIWRITPQDNPGVVTMPGVGIAISDRNGDPTNVAARVVGMGAGWTTALNAGAYQSTTRTAGIVVGTSPFIGNKPDALGAWVPGGEVGDDTNIGLQDGPLGTASVIGRTNPNDVNYNASDNVGTPVTDGVYALLFHTFDVAGAVNFTAKFKVEYAIVELYPPGEFSP